MDILLADDCKRIRFALRILLEQQPEWRVVGEASDAIELMDQAKRQGPDLILVDGSLPGIQRNDTLNFLREVSPKACIVALVEPRTSSNEQTQIMADAFATKVNSPDLLLSVIRNCLERKNWP